MQQPLLLVMQKQYSTTHHHEGTAESELLLQPSHLAQSRDHCRERWGLSEQVQLILP